MTIRHFALAAIAALAAGGLALAQTQPIPGAKTASGQPAPVTGAAIVVAPAGGGAGLGTVVAPDQPLPVTCISGCSGGGGGGGTASFTAASGGTIATAAGANKPAALDLFSSQSVLVKDATGAAVDWSAPVPVTQSGTWNITNLSGTVSLPTGAATEASLVKLPLAQGSTTSGQSGALVQGAVTTAAPSYTTGQTSPLSLTTGGALRVDVGAAGFTATGPTADDAAATGNPVQVAGKYTATAPTFTDGDTAQLRLNAKGGLVIGGRTADDAAAPTSADTFPVPLGGIYNSSLPNYTAGDRTQAQFTQFGMLRTFATGLPATGSDGLSNTSGLRQFGRSDQDSAGGILQSSGYMFNGSTWDRPRGILGAVASAGVGVAAVENPGRPTSRITTNTSTNAIKTGAGVFGSICVGVPGASANTATIYDNTTATGTVIAVIDTTTRGCMEYNAAFTTGLSVLTATGTAADLTVMFR